MDKIISAGIDIGTTTTQVVFSQLTIVEQGGFGMVPSYKLANKQILYRSGVHFTPLDGAKIDGWAVKELIAGEYEKAGFRPQDIDSGAVIITGESARKANAHLVVDQIAEYAGGFVVAIAGPELEIILSGKES